MTVRVLVVEPARLVGEALGCLLRASDGVECVGWAPTLAEARQAARKKRADVVVLSVRLPVVECMATIRQWRARLGAVRILALVERHESLLAGQLLEAGAAGVAAMTDSPRQWVQSIQNTARGQNPVGQNDTPSDATGMPRSDRDADSDLTNRQREILRAVAEGLTSREIASTFGITVKTVEAHRHHICRRLRLRSIAELTKYALREGLTDLGV